MIVFFLKLYINRTTLSINKLKSIYKYFTTFYQFIKLKKNISKFLLHSLINESITQHRWSCINNI